jgi:hypothetical protein
MSTEHDFEQIEQANATGRVPRTLRFVQRAV